MRMTHLGMLPLHNVTLFNEGITVQSTSAQVCGQRHQVDRGVWTYIGTFLSLQVIYCHFSEASHLTTLTFDIRTNNIFDLEVMQ